jgi:hypothetical protein
MTRALGLTDLTSVDDEASPATFRVALGVERPTAGTGGP